MKDNIITAIIALVSVCLLGLGFYLWFPKTEEPDTFSPPAWGAGRETAETERETMETCKLPASNETPEIIEETAPETEISQVTVKLADTETLEVIPAVEGKYLNVPMSAELQDYARSVSEEYKIPFELTMAVIYVESSFNVYAISDTKDHGLMQISYTVQDWLASELGITDFFDPYQNITAGVYVLADKISKSGGDFTQALMRYHDGDDGALELMKQGIFSTEYTEAVLSKYYEYIREG